jgi:Protein of unknown function (DUF3489)
MSILLRILLLVFPNGVMNVVTATAVRRSETMTTFLIDAQNNISALGSQQADFEGEIFGSQQELADLAAKWPTNRLIEVWNGIPGLTPVKKFTDRKSAVSRIWKAIQSLDGGATEEATTAPEQAQDVGDAAKPKEERKAKGGAPGAKGTPTKTKANKKATTANKALKGKKAAKAQEATEPREGSKTAQVVAMLQRKNGATLSEIMDKMGWLRHTVRGFMAGAMKKAGYNVESFKPEGGERTYRISK